MARHWTQNLPEVGSWADDTARKVESIDAEIAKLQSAIRALRRDRDRVEREALERAKRDWSESEIAQAQQAAE